MPEDTVQTDEEVVEEEEMVDESEDAIEEEAPVRKSSAFYAQKRIIEKQNKTIEKLKEGKDEDDEELTPSARSLVLKELSPAIEGLKSQSDELELRQHFLEHPEHKKFEKAIRNRMAAWGNIPVSEIAKTVTYGQEQKVRTEKKGEAITRTKGSALKGSSARAEEAKLPSTQAEFEAIYKDVKRNKTTIKLGE